MNNIRHIFHIIRNRILIISIVIVCTLCIAISVISSIVFQQYLRGTLIQSTETSLRLIASSMSSSMNDVYRMVRFCQTNSDIVSYVSHNPDPGSVLSVSTYDVLNEESNRNSSIGYMPRIAVVCKERYLQVVTTIYSSTSDLATGIPALPFYETLIHADDYDFSTGFVADPFHRSGHMVLPILRPISYQYNSRQAGCVFIEVSEDLFTDPLDDVSVAEDCTFYLTIADHNYLYENGALTEITQDYTYKEDLSSLARAEDTIISMVEDQAHEEQIYVTAPLNMTDCYISLSISHAERTSRAARFTVLMTCVVIGILAISMLMMSHQLAQERRRRDLEYKMLQSQVNPHFLYNTLNSIKWMATIQGATGIAEMTTSLSRLLKSISKGTSLIINIREELSLLENYYTIQSYRYGGTITMEIQVDDEALYDCEIVKFTLQPLVENAIFHGIEPKGAGSIRIHVGYEQPQDHRNIRIDVTDDGVGIPADKAAQILTNNEENKAEFFREIGVSNVHQRIQYQYGQNYGITIESVVGEYTTMSVHLPRRTWNHEG